MDGVHPYTALGKFGTSMDAVSSALALKADAADVSAELDAISARELAYSAGIDQMFNRYNPTGLARGSLVSKLIEPTVPVDAIQGGATVIYGGMTLKNWITDGDFRLPEIKSLVRALHALRLLVLRLPVLP